MTGKLRWLKAVLRPGTRERTIRECRRCGTTVDSEQAVCPDCGTGGIACYRLPE